MLSVRLGSFAVRVLLPTVLVMALAYSVASLVLPRMVAAWEIVALACGLWAFLIRLKDVSSPRANPGSER